MNPPLILRSPRARSQSNPSPRSRRWVPDSGVALFASLSWMVTVCVAFTLMNWDRRRLKAFVRAVLTALLIASVIFEVLYPQYAIEVGEGTLKDSWRGLTAQKSQFGMLSSFGVVFCL